MLQNKKFMMDNDSVKHDSNNLNGNKANNFNNIKLMNDKVYSSKKQRVHHSYENHSSTHQRSGSKQKFVPQVRVSLIHEIDKIVKYSRKMNKAKLKKELKQDLDVYNPPQKLYKTAKLSGIKPRNQNVSRSKKRDRQEGVHNRAERSSKRKHNQNNGRMNSIENERQSKEYQKVLTHDHGKKEGNVSVESSIYYHAYNKH